MERFGGTGVQFANRRRDTRLAGIGLATATLFAIGLGTPAAAQPSAPDLNNAGAEACRPSDAHEIATAEAAPEAVELAAAGDRIGLAWTLHGQDDAIRFIWLGPDAAPAGEALTLSTPTNGGSILAMTHVDGQVVVQTSDRCPNRAHGWCLFTLPIPVAGGPAADPISTYVENFPSPLIDVPVGDSLYTLFAGEYSGTAVARYDAGSGEVSVVAGLDITHASRPFDMTWTGTELVVLHPGSVVEGDESYYLSRIDPSSGAAERIRFRDLRGQVPMGIDWHDGALSVVLSTADDWRSLARAGRFGLDGRRIGDLVRIGSYDELPAPLGSRLDAVLEEGPDRVVDLQRRRIDDRDYGAAVPVGPRGDRSFDARRGDLVFDGSAFGVAWFAREDDRWVLRARSIDCRATASAAP